MSTTFAGWAQHLYKLSRQKTESPLSVAYRSGGFAGWTHIDAANGSLAIYDLSGPDIITPIITIPAPTTGPPYAPSEWYLAVYHPVNVTAACVPTASPSSSAQCALGANGSLARRFHVTPSSSRASALETIAAYVEHNGMLAPTSGKAHAWASPPYPTLRAKLGSAPGGGPNFWRQVYQAPLLKLDAVAVGLPYANYSSQVSAVRCVVNGCVERDRRISANGIIPISISTDLPRPSRPESNSLLRFRARWIRLKFPGHATTRPCIWIVL